MSTPQAKNDKRESFVSSSGLSEVSTTIPKEDDRNTSSITFADSRLSQSTLITNPTMGNHSQKLTDSNLSLTSQLPQSMFLPSNGDSETSWKILKELLPPYFIAGFAMVGAGVLLEYFTGWEVYKKIPALVIVTTPLLGLKGDLEMTLGSRLSTQANLGNLDDKKQRGQICLANLCLDQHQANICAVVAVIVAVLMKLCHGPEGVTGPNILVMSSACILTASIVSVFLGSIMVLTVVLSRKFHMNPDNIASPIAGSLGDVVTLTTLSLIATWLYLKYDEPSSGWLPYFIIVFYLGVVTPVCGFVAHRNQYTKHALNQGYVPLIVSVALSTVGGLFLDLALAHHDKSGVALYQPLINGIGGNLVSVQSSRAATYLYKHYTPGFLPGGESIWVTPHTVFFGKDDSSRSARLLLLIAIPGHVVFTAAAHLISKYASGYPDTSYGLVFVIFFLLAALWQIAILLYASKLLANICWKKRLDPDTSSIPYLTALGDLFGSCFLYFAFLIITSIPNKI